MHLRIPRTMFAHVEKLGTPARPYELLDLAVARYFQDGAPEGYFPPMTADTVEADYSPRGDLVSNLRRIAANRKIEESELVLIALQRWLGGKD